MTNHDVFDAMARLTLAQQMLHDEVQAKGSWDGRDLRDVLIEADATPEDKAAVAEVFGGQGAGAEFLNGDAR